jgi:hypothetical protein
MRDRFSGLCFGFALSYILHFPLPVVILLLITIAGAHIILTGEQK